MQDFWNKTVDTLTVGVGTAMDMTGTKKLPASESVKKAVEKLDTIESQTQQMSRALAELMQALSECGNANFEVTNKYANFFNNGDQSLGSTSKNFSIVCDKLRNEPIKLGIDDLRKEFQTIQSVAAECRKLREILTDYKNKLILMLHAADKLEKSKKKDKSTKDLEKEVAQKTSAVKSAESNFLAGIESLEVKSNEVYKNAFYFHQKIMRDMINKVKQEFAMESAALNISSGEFAPIV